METLKTIEQWLKEGLTETHYREALAAMTHQSTLSRLDNKTSDFKEALEGAFRWGLGSNISESGWLEIYNDGGSARKSLALLTALIIDWGKQRNFYGEGGATKQMQFVKLMEECGELAGNLSRGRDVKDDIGDIFVVLTHIAVLSGTSLRECVDVAYNDIKDRKGQFIDGSFIKESDL